MTIQPMNDHVLLRPIEAEERTAGGLYLPDTAREKPAEGTVIGIPAGGAQGLALGERVIYKRHAGEEVRANSETLRLVPVTELLAKVVEADEIAA